MAGRWFAVTKLFHDLAIVLGHSKMLSKPIEIAASTSSGILAVAGPESLVAPRLGYWGQGVNAGF